MSVRLLKESLKIHESSSETCHITQTVKVSVAGGLLTIIHDKIFNFGWNKNTIKISFATLGTKGLKFPPIFDIYGVH